MVAYAETGPAWCRGDQLLPCRLAFTNPERVTGYSYKGRTMVTRARSRVGGPEARLSGLRQIDAVVHRVPQFLFAAEIALGRLHRDMPEQKLNLL